MATSPRIPVAPVSDGGAMPAPLRAALTSLIGAGQRVEAIKHYRLATGADLVTAKGVVDALAADVPMSGGDAAGSAPRRWQMQSSVPFTLAKGIGVTRLVALFLWLCALLAALAAGWQAYDRDTIRRDWPVVDARVAACRLVEHQSRRQGIDLWTLEKLGPSMSLACSFRYRVGGRDYTAETRSHSSDAPAAAKAMQRWAATHPPGTRQSVYRDPADPQRISLGDADAAYEPDTVEHRVQLAVMFGSAGILLWGVSLWLAAIQRRREMSAG
ncbi:MAG TPA: DUF3592 domain-containing protein [Stellaceae bacterium]|nr:DUF3592 domain-containing protein [Stellaceae bacterium]